MLQRWIAHGVASDLPTIHVVSDSTGTTAKAVARAALASFDETNSYLEVLPGIKTPRELTEELSAHLEHHREKHIPGAFIIFYTLVGEQLREAMDDFVKQASAAIEEAKRAQGEEAASPNRIIAVDVLDKAHSALADATGRTPEPHPGALYSVDDAYFRRLEAINFTINHDDGRNPQDLTKADIVLIGVSRSSKTPLSIYLSQLGLKVANVPLDSETEPPKELFDVDPTRLFGLTTTAEILVEVRKRRLAKAAHVASRYSEFESVYQELESAHDLMRRLGCIVIRTDNRAIEETAQEILRYHESAHPRL
ncbi:putative uncharacterized protein [Eggerthella sp. CAG:298]|nr:putative uncharacterized protein [Eggerthella sp. CAG:298]